MTRRPWIAFLLLVCACAGLMAQETKTFTVRILDGRTGAKIVPDNVEVHVDRKHDAHVEWVKLQDDGTALVTVPANATSIALRATYEASTNYYVNCDVSKQKDPSTETWFPLADVLSDGLVMPNECGKARNMKDVKFEAKPGEFLLLVRKRSLRDTMQEMR